MRRAESKFLFRRSFHYFLGLLLLLIFIPACASQYGLTNSLDKEISREYEPNLFYRWGDSPKEDNGIPVWAEAEVESSSWIKMEGLVWAENRPEGEDSLAEADSS